MYYRVCFPSWLLILSRKFRPSPQCDLPIVFFLRGFAHFSRWMRPFFAMRRDWRSFLRTFYWGCSFSERGKVFGRLSTNGFESDGSANGIARFRIEGSPALRRKTRPPSLSPRYFCFVGIRPFSPHGEGRSFSLRMSQCRSPSFSGRIP